jgi:hypothetical protein
MPKTKRFRAKVEAVLIATDPRTFVTQRIPQTEIDLAGIPGDRHYGLTRYAGAREPMYPKGAEIRNRRQLSIVSIEECHLIAQSLGLEVVLPEWLGANLLLSGLPNLTLLPCGTRLMFPSGACLICEGENTPCRYPAKVLQKLHPQHPNVLKNFVRVAQKRRGIICSVERSGEICQSDTIQILQEYNTTPLLSSVV